MTTELSSGAITSILEAVPGIATVLRSPVADAIVNLSRSAAGLAPFDKKDAHELVRYAVRRGLIRSDEGDRVLAEVDGSSRAASARGAAPHGSAPKPKPAPAKRPTAKKAHHRPAKPRRKAARGHRARARAKKK